MVMSYRTEGDPKWFLHINLVSWIYRVSSQNNKYSLNLLPVYFVCYFQSLSDLPHPTRPNTSSLEHAGEFNKNIDDPYVEVTNEKIAWQLVL